MVKAVPDVQVSQSEFSVKVLWLSGRRKLLTRLTSRLIWDAIGTTFTGC